MRRRRTWTAAAVALAALLLARQPVAAHAELLASTPAPGEQVETAPAEVVLTFDDEVSDDSAFTVTDAGGRTVGTGELDLFVAERNVLRGEVAIVDPGSYTVEWTATDVADGDSTSGEFTFTFRPASPRISPSSTAPAPTGGPDTAVSATAPLQVAPPMSVAGALLLLGGLAGTALIARRGHRPRG